MRMQRWNILTALTSWKLVALLWKDPRRIWQPIRELKKPTLVSKSRNFSRTIFVLFAPSQTPPKLKSGLIFLVLLSLIALAPSCTSKQNSTADHATLNIGFFGDLTGPTFNFGTSAKNGVLMAADEINQAGGINGRQIDIVIEDDKGSPEEAAQVTGKLIDRYKVVAIIGAGASGNSLAAAPKAQSARVPLIAPSSTNPAVTQVGDYIFRACFIDAFQGEVMAKFAVNTLKAKRAAIMLDFNSPYSRGLMDFFWFSFLKLGGEIVSKRMYTLTDSDYLGQLDLTRLATP